MRSRKHLALIFAAAFAAAGCSGDRATAPPNETSQAIAELEQAAAQMGLGTDPSAALTIQTVAAALRAGAPVKPVEITVDGEPQKWYAFGHQIVFDPATGSSPIDFGPTGGVRALLAWRASGTRAQVIHLLAMGASGPVGRLGPIDPNNGSSFKFPSTLMYSEGRTLVWDAVTGQQTSDAQPTTTPCPSPPRPAGAPVGPKCVLANFEFGFSGVVAEPFSAPFSPLAATPPASASAKRNLAMREQPIDGIQITLDMRVFGVPLSTARRTP